MEFCRDNFVATLFKKKEGQSDQLTGIRHLMSDCQFLLPLKYNGPMVSCQNLD